MKKIGLLILLIFLAFSKIGFSQEKSSIKPQTVRTEQIKKGNNRTGNRPKKPVKKRIHRRGTMRHGREVKL